MVSRSLVKMQTSAAISIARRASFLLGREDEDLFDSALVIVDDPHRPRGLRSKPFDGEGLPTARRNLVENGRLTGWLLDGGRPPFDDDLDDDVPF